MLLAQNSNFLLVIEKWLSNNMERSMVEEGNATKRYEELILILG